MNSKATVYMATQMGELELGFTEKGLALLSIKAKNRSKNNNVQKTDNINQNNLVVTQLEQYFSSASSFNNIPLVPKGTSFQQSVWKELCKIPLGETRTYGQIAHILNSGARAVGNACRKNPIQIIIPCHRVVSATGMGGYAGETQGTQLDIKSWLLRHEGVRL